MKVSTLALATALLAFGSTSELSAQSQYTLDVDGPTSNFEFDGDSSVGRIKGTPPYFDMDGTIDMLIDPASGLFNTGQFNGGQMYTVPARIEAKIPNIFGWLPPLAEIDIDDAVYVPSSASFAVAGNGDFATDIVLTPIAGTVTVDPLVGATETTPLADFGPTDPTPVNGNLADLAGTVTLAMPIDVVVDNDDGQGNWSTLHLWGDLNAAAPINQDMTLVAVGPLTSGGTGTFDVSYGNANTATFLAYGLSLGSTPVPPLGITLGLASAVQVGTSKMSDAAGSASWTENVPPGIAGVTVYLQACQAGLISNIITEVIL
jgi:hypothetical protein